jgi:hypothetical protein
VQQNRKRRVAAHDPIQRDDGGHRHVGSDRHEVTVHELNGVGHAAPFRFLLRGRDVRR